MTTATEQTHLASELFAFKEAYEQANNSHDISRITPFIEEDATYWFTDGSYRGAAEIRAATEKNVRQDTGRVVRGPGPRMAGAHGSGRRVPVSVRLDWHCRREALLRSRPRH